MIKMKTLIVMFAVIAVTFFILYTFTVTYTDSTVQIKEYIVQSQVTLNVPVHTPSMVTFMGGHVRPILYLIGHQF